MAFKPYQRYALVVLTSVYALSFMDRIMIGMLMQPIKEELQLSDTQLGFLTGIAFALFYATLGIPFARWADRGNRVTIISLAMGLWGVMVMLCGMVTNFFQMALVRIGAAVGEAGCMPPAYSLIGDEFEEDKRTRALSIYMSGISVSIVLSFLLAGWMNDHYGWRAAFFVISVPGLVMAILVKLTLREPRKQGSDKVEMPVDSVSMWQSIVQLWRIPTYRNLVMALSLVNLVGIGVGQWLPSFFIRAHSMDTTNLGIWLGLVGGGSGILGTYLGGYLLDRYYRYDHRAQLRCVALGVIFFPVTYYVLLFTSISTLSLTMLIPLNIMSLFFYGPVMSILQSIVEDRRRAIAVALSLLVLNLIGMGLGPQIVGILSDYFSESRDSAGALRLAMAVTSIVAFASAYYFWRAGASIKPVPDNQAETAPDGALVEES